MAARDDVSEIFDSSAWRPIDGFDLTDLTYHRAVDSGVVRIAFDRPEVRNAFRPQTVDELITALEHARLSTDVGCVILTGNGPSPKDGGWAFCSGGDQRIRGRDGYRYEGETAGPSGGRLHILEVQRLIRFMPKVVVALVPGWAAGGGHSLHVVCDLTIASAEHGRFKQTDADAWTAVPGFELTDITYHRAVGSGTVRIAFDRPEVRNAFRPQTVDELYRALDHARMSSDVGCVLLTGNGPSPKDGGWAFCSGGDQRIRGRSGYQYADGETAETVDQARVKAAGGRLHILEVQRLIRTMPKVVIAVVNGWAAGGGHSLHVVCDLTIASREHARFKQTDADVGSFDGGYGSAYLARMVGQKNAREIFFLGRTYDAEAMHRMGAVNLVADHADLERTALEAAAEINCKSPTAQRMLKFAFNLTDDGLMGQQVFAGEATRLAYMTDEAVEGRDSFLDKREPDWSPFPWYY